MKKAVTPISLAGSELGEVRHVCAFFNSDDEEYRVLLPFIKDGLECGDKAVHVVNPERHQDHLHRLAAAGIDTAATQRSGQFELRSNTETYLADGHFDQDRMLEFFEQLASGNAHNGRDSHLSIASPTVSPGSCQLRLGAREARPAADPLNAMMS